MTFSRSSRTAPVGRPPALLGRYAAWIEAVVPTLFVGALIVAALAYGAVTDVAERRLLLALAAIYLVSTVVGVLRKHTVPCNFLVLLVGALLALATALQPTFEARGYESALVAVLAFLIAQSIAPTARGVTLVLASLATLGLVQAAMGIVQSLQATVSSDEISRAHGTLVNPNHYAGLLNLSLGIWLACLLTRKRHVERGSEDAARSWLLGIACLTIALGLAFSLSRGGVLTATVLVGVLFVASRRAARANGRGPGRGRVLWVTMACGALLATALSANALLARLSDLSDVGRLRLYRDATTMIADSPLLGHGAGRFTWTFRPYQRSDLLEYYDHAHNDYLEIAADWGVPALIVLLLAIVWRVRGLLRALPRASRTEARTTLAALGALCALGVHGLGDFNAQLPSQLAIAAALFGLALPRAPESTSARPLVPLATMALVVSLLFATYDLVTRERASTALSRGGADGVEGALRWRQDDPTAHFVAAQHAQRRGSTTDLEQAASSLRRVVELNPLQWRAWSELGSVLELLGEPTAARNAHDEAKRIQPLDPQIAWPFAQFLLRRGETNAALEEFRVVAAGNPPLLPGAFDSLTRAGVAWTRAAELFPADPPGQFHLLQIASRASRRGALDAAELVALWRRVLPTAREQRGAAELGFFPSLLHEQGKPIAALRAFRELHANDPQAPRETIYNGDFDRPLVGAPLGWQILSSEEDSAHVTRVERDDPALRIDVTGAEAWSGLRLTLALEPGRYALHFRSRSVRESTSKGRGPWLEIRGEDRPLATSQRLDEGPHWTLSRLRFSVDQPTRFDPDRGPSHQIVVRIEGEGSTAADELVSFEIDSFRLETLEEVARPTDSTTVQLP